MKTERTIATPWTWQFPPIAEPPSLIMQIGRIRGEVREVVSAKLDGEGVERTAEELMDVIHAAETALRLLPLNELQLDAIKRGVVEKNDRRGYYEKG